MTQLGGRQWWTAVSAALTSEQHLATEAVVAYVDNELTLPAHARATQHLAQCALCTAEVAAQRQARTAVRSAITPSLSPALLAALHAIPQSADLPPGPDGLAVDENGELVVAQRPLPARDDTPLGLPGPLLEAQSPFRMRSSRRVQSAVMVSGLMLGALVLVSAAEPSLPGVPRPGVDGGNAPVPVPARFEIERRRTDAEPSRHAVASGLLPR